MGSDRISSFGTPFLFLSHFRQELYEKLVCGFFLEYLEICQRLSSNFFLISYWFFAINYRKVTNTFK